MAELSPWWLPPSTPIQILDTTLIEKRIRLLRFTLLRLLRLNLKIEVDGPAVASKLLRRAFTWREIGITAALRVLAADMV